MGDLFEGLNLRNSTSLSPTSATTSSAAATPNATIIGDPSSSSSNDTFSGKSNPTTVSASKSEDVTTPSTEENGKGADVMEDGRGEEEQHYDGHGHRRPLVICGPSGAGKGTMIDLLMKRFSNDQFGFSVSHTTRQPREGEVNGIHYHFTTVDDMKQLIDEGKFIEHAEVHGRYYGTSFAAVESVQTSGKVCILDIDMQGVKNVKESPLEPYYIFIAPPSLEILEERLRGRGTESEEDIQTRLSNASKELTFGQTPNMFDLFVTNDDLERSFEILASKVKEYYPDLKEDVTSTITAVAEEEAKLVATVSQEEEEEKGNGEKKSSVSSSEQGPEDEQQPQSSPSSSSSLLPPPLVFCGPSGAGKGTMINLLMERFNNADKQQLGFCVSHTTRSPREGEKDGIHYHFTTVDKMKQLIQEGNFIEYAEVHGRYYGTSFEAMKSVQKEGKICILDIDVQGVQNVKQCVPPIDAHYIFVAPPSMDILEQRLRGRGTEKEEDIMKRLKNAKDEMLFGSTHKETSNYFDLYLINDDLTTSLKELVIRVKELYPHLKDNGTTTSSSNGDGATETHQASAATTTNAEDMTAVARGTSAPDDATSKSATTTNHETPNAVPPPPPPRVSSSPVDDGTKNKIISDTKQPKPQETSGGPSPLMDAPSSTAASSSNPPPPPPPPHLSPKKLVTPAKMAEGASLVDTSTTAPASVVTIRSSQPNKHKANNNNTSMDVLSSCLRALEKFVSRTKPKMPYDVPKKPKKVRGQTDVDETVVPPSRVLAKLTGMNWLGTFVGATHYGLNYNSPYVGECVGAMNQLLDVMDGALKEQEKIQKLEQPRPYQTTRQESFKDITKRRTEWVNKLVSTYVHLVCVWCSYSNVQANHAAAAAAAAATSNGGTAGEGAAAGQNTDPPVSSQLLCWAVDTAEMMVAHGCFDASVASVAAANNGNLSTTARDTANSSIMDSSSSSALSPGSTSFDIAPHHVAPIQQLSDSICRMDLTTEESELAVLKFILTTGSRSCVTPVGELSMLHGKDLLQLIRTTYHIYLKTSSEPNKTTARAALQQLVASVFQRMDLQDPLGIAATGARSISSTTGVRSSPVTAAAVALSSSTTTPATAAVRSAFHQEGPFDSPHGMMSRPQIGSSETPGSPAKREALEQFFQDHPDVAVAVQPPRLSPQAQPQLPLMTSTSTSTTLPESDAWYPAVVTSLGFPSTNENMQPTLTSMSTPAVTTKPPKKQQQPQTTSSITATPKRSHKKNTVTGSTTSPLEDANVPINVGSKTGGGGPTAATTTTSFASPSHLDAFLVLRSLCKLSMKSLPDDMLMVTGGSSSSSSHDHDDLLNSNANPAMESKILALELLLYVLDHATPSASLFSTPSFSFAIRNYLCVSLLKNCTSNNTRIVALSLRLFIPIIRHFREGLKTEIEAFVTNVFFVILDSPNSTVEHKSLVVTLFQEICSCEDTLAEIFLNYDCDLSAVDLFHRIVTTLSKVASKKGGETDFSDRGVFSSGNPQSAQLRQSHRELKLSAMRALKEVLGSLYESLKVERYNNNSLATGLDSTMSGDGMSIVSGNPSLSSTGGGNNPNDATVATASSTIMSGDHPIGTTTTTTTMTPAKAPSSMNGGSTTTTSASKGPSSTGSSIVKMYDSKKKRREQEIEIYLRFNQKPAAGIKFAGECGHLEADNPVEVAKFLLAKKDKVDKTQIGDYLGREPDYQGGFAVRVLHAYVDMLDFSDMSFDDAIRYFLSGFRLPGEAQKIDRIMEKFAERFCQQNPSVFPTADTAFILGFSVIMLNTDLHNPAIKEERRMTKDGFRRNNRGICDGQDLPEEFLNGIFDRIKAQPISLKEDDDARRKAGQGGGAGGGGDGESRQTTTTNFLFGHNVHETEEQNRHRETKFLQERDQIVRSTEMIFQQHRRKGGGGGASGTSRSSTTDGTSGSGSSNKRNGKLSSSATSTGTSKGYLQGLPPQASTKFVRTTDALKDEYVVPMFDVTWGPALAVFSTAVEGTSDLEKLASYASDHELDLIYENAADILDVALSGFRLAICTAGLCGNDTARSAFVQALYNFSRLGTHRLLASRHVRCSQALLNLAHDDGELLGDTWEHIFKALSEVNRLLHVHDELIRQERGRSSSGRNTRGGRPTHHHDDNSLSSQDSDYYGGGGASTTTDGELALHEDDMDHRAIDEENAIMIYEAVPEGVVDTIYHKSSKLSNPAVKEFIFQLCRVSRMEIAGYGGHVGSRANAIVVGDDLDLLLGSGGATSAAGDVDGAGAAGGGGGGGGRKHQPIIYSLQQIVQVTHYNMESRSRLVFAELWSTVAAHLTSTALHSNPAVTMYAVDSLRQLGLQFLQRDELGMFEFQRKFLKPYEYVMERSREPSTKELLLASVQQMIVMFGGGSGSSGGGGGKLRSGWKSVLIVLGLAAKDVDDRIATMGYEILNDLVTRTLSNNNDTKDGKSAAPSSSSSSLLLKEHFVDLSDALLMYVSGPRVELGFNAIDLIMDMATWLADDCTPLPLMRKASVEPHHHPQQQQQHEHASASNSDLELWWPILLGLSRNVGHSDLTVRQKSLSTLVTLIEQNFFPRSTGGGDVDQKAAAPMEDHVSLQTLRMIFKGVLLPTLEHAETDVSSLLYATPQALPDDFHRFTNSKKGASTTSSAAAAAASTSATTSSPPKDTKPGNQGGGKGGFLGLGRRQSRNLGRKDSSNTSRRSVDGTDGQPQQEQQQQQLRDTQQQEQTCWINTTLDPLLDACGSIGLRSMDAFESDDMIEEVLSVFNACLVSDSGAVVVKGLYHLHSFITEGLLGSKNHSISTDTWATVCHMLRRTLRGQPPGDFGGAAGGAELMMLQRRMYIPSHVTNIVGSLLLCDDNETFRMGVQWYLFLTSGLAQGIDQWEKSAASTEGKMVSDPAAPSHVENALYGRTLLVKLMLRLASNINNVVVSSSEEDQTDVACELLKDETQKLLTTLALKEKAIGGGQSPTVLALKKQKQDPIKIMELDRLAIVIQTLLEGYCKLENECLDKISPCLISLVDSNSPTTKINNDTVQKAMKKLSSRLLETSTATTASSNDSKE